MKDDITVEILKDIRASVRETQSDLGTLRIEVGALREDLSGRITSEVGTLRAEMGTLREELSRRIVESEIRTATVMADLAGSVREVASILRSQHDLRPRVERCETEIAELKKRIPA